jgi:hypothetical protein
MYCGVKLGIFLEDEPKGSKTFAKLSIAIGEDDDGDVCFEDAGLDYHHASIHLLPEGALVEDNGSDAGTFLNGRKVTAPTKIAEGDTITAGKVRIVVEQLFPEGTVIEIPPRYCAVKILDKCPHCGSGLPINGVMREIRCGACQKDVRFRDEYWKMILEDLDNDYDQGGGSYTINMESQVGWKAESPKCGGCGADLAAREIPVGTDGEIPCPGCGRQFTTYPAPEWVKAVLPSLRQIYDGERQGGPTPAGASVAEAAEGAKPVILSCPQCRGALRIDTGSQRTTTCQFCNADVYLPDDLWSRLHPVKTTARWYVRFDGKRQKELEEEAERPERVEEVRERLTTAKKTRGVEVIAKLIPFLGIGIPIVIVAVTVLSSLGGGSGWAAEALDAGAARLGQMSFAVNKPVSFAARTDAYSVVWTPSPESPSYVHVAHAPHFPGTAQETMSMIQAQFKTGMDVASVTPVAGGFLAVLKDKAGRSAEAQVFRRKAPAGPGLLCTAHVATESGQLGDVDELVSYLTEICGSLTIY